MARKHIVSSDDEDASSPKRARHNGTVSSLPRSTPPDARSDTQHQNANDDEPDEDMDAIESDDEAQRENVQRIRTQREQQQPKQTVAGIVQEVRLENFMCHKLLSVKFGPQINFLVGMNGSGKSAVLTAISMCLGGSAKLTNRASKMSDFVTSGEYAAKIQVRLSNTADEKGETFQPEIFGDSIWVERRILSTTGASHYKIMDSKMNVVDGKKQTLEAILDHFGIQIDNPMTVLTQDQSRQFLASSSTKDKYNFFLRGTRLAQLVDEYEVLRNNTEQMQDALDRRSEVIPELKEAYKVARARAKDAQIAISEQDRVEQLKNELVWSYVAQAEHQVNRAKDIAQAERDKLEPAQREADEAQAEITTITDQLNVCREAVAEQNAEIETHRPRLDELNKLISAARDEVLKWKATERTTNAEIERLKGSVTHLESQIANEKVRLGRNIQAEQQAILDEMEQSRAEKIEQEAKIRKARDLLDQIERQSQELGETLAQHKERLEGAYNARSSAEGRLNNLKASGKNLMLRFGGRNANAMPALMAAINNEKRWRQKPVGPLGMYVKLTQPAYAAVAESLMAQTLNALLVTNDEDRALLSKLHRNSKIGYDVPIILVREDERFWADFQTKQPSPDVLTFYRALKIDNRLAEQALIVATNIEAIALVRQRSDGDVLMRTSPKSILFTCSADLYQIRFNEAQAEVQRIDRDIQGIMADKAEVDHQLTELNRSRQQYKRQIKECTDRITRLNHKIAVNQEKLDSEQPSALAQLEDMLQQAKDNLESVYKQYKAGAENHNQRKQAGEPLVVEKHAVQKKVEKATSGISKLEKKIGECVTQVTKLNRLVAQKRADVEKYQGHLVNIEHQTQTLVAELETRKEAASAICERPAPVQDKNKRPKNRAPEAIQREIESLEKALRARERAQGATVEQILEECATRKMALKEAQENVGSLKQLWLLLESAHMSRVAKWTDFRDTIGYRAKELFAFHMSTRGFMGKITFDHDHMRLHMKVQTDDGAGGKKLYKDTRSLSGGEKSFTTISLLLTMWESNASPLRCLDEFDVFMDAVNRRISIKMLTDAAKASAGQFIIITPQEMNDFKFDDDVKVNKMANPDRRQGALAATA
ncbi:Structural maintenance of chromosomes protein 6 [Microbotryomycetes sp. JL221]|nr:Structural maintenance of chromosomes protein 6 [Microbotryomycetes sp. JL221]